MFSRSLLSCLIVTALACGGRATANGGTGGQATGGSGASAGQAASGSGGIDPYCEIDTSLPPPYAITFTLTNNYALPLYLFEECGEVSHSILSCAEGYSRGLPTQASCGVPECPTDPSLCTPGGICGPCASVAVVLAPGDSYELFWAGLLYIGETRPPACGCYTVQNAQSGRYSIEVPVFETEAKAQSQQPMFTVGQEFELPTLGNLVNVNLYARL